MTETKTFEEKLRTVIAKLNVPKSNFNKFGNYNYRSCEDILEAVKPLLHQEGLRLVIGDEVVQVGNHNYVKAIATIHDEAGKSQSASAYAREAEEQKGMSDSQITGSTSSYARKYALNGLLCIDDTKDADTNENHDQINNAPVPPAYELTGSRLMKIKSLLNKLDVFEESRDKIISQVTSDKKADELIEQLEEKVAAKTEPRVEPV